MMRVTQTLIPTLREDPAEADIISHQLLLRAGMLRRLAAGVYSLLPLGYRVVKKIEQIVREEMDRAGGAELLLPIIQPAEIWHDSGRWEVYGPEMFRLHDRHERSFCLGPTHEEVITELVRHNVKSYRQLPLLLYQIQNKYRDERRPRFGLLRGREFIMKDLYSFDKNEEGLAVSYRKMYDAYTRIFTRCGLSFRAVEADSGAIGGGYSHEFMVLADNGEAEIVYCTQCNYAADVEKAPCEPQQPPAQTELSDLELVATPETRTVQEVAYFLKVKPWQILKTLFYQSDDKIVAVLVRGDRTVNEVKVKNYLQVNQLEIAGDEELLAGYGIPCGYAGPVGLREKGLSRIIADEEVKYLSDAVAGANRKGFHYYHVNPGRDFQVDAFGDFRTAEAGDLCIHCHHPLASRRGIEVGQVFKLGTKYSKALGAMALDEQGKEMPVVMGCYGIGVTRTMAAAVEQNYDADGIIWPVNIAPCEVVLIAINQRDPQQTSIAEKIYQDLIAQDIDVIYDDRFERPGVKFKDADLIGYPVRLVVGKQAVTEELVEVRMRHSGVVVRNKTDEVVDYVSTSLNKLRENPLP